MDISSTSPRGLLDGACSKHSAHDPRLMSPGCHRTQPPHSLYAFFFSILSLVSDHASVCHRAAVPQRKRLQQRSAYPSSERSRPGPRQHRLGEYIRCPPQPIHLRCSRSQRRLRSSQPISSPEQCAAIEPTGPGVQRPLFASRPVSSERQPQSSHLSRQPRVVVTAAVHVLHPAHATPAAQPPPRELICRRGCPQQAWLERSLPHRGSQSSV